MLALLYIVLVVTTIFLVLPQFVTELDPEVEYLAPVAFLSTFVVSAAVMAFLFFFEPVALLLSNKRNEAASFFLKTIGTFVVAGIVLLISLFFLI